VKDRSFDTLTRRATIMALGAAGLGGLAASVAAAKKKRKRGDVNKLCKTQIEPCALTLTGQCGEDPACIEAMTACCAILGTCNFTEMFACFEAFYEPQP
jgi:hypothetical protein